MENTIIEYRIKAVYGKELMYIVNEDKAKAVSSLTGGKTLSINAMTGLRMLGFDLQQVI